MSDLIEGEVCTREQLLGAKTRRFLDFEVPGLPGRVRIRSLNEKEKSAFEVEFLTKKGTPDRDRVEQMRRRLVCLTVVDATGSTILRDEDVRQLEEIDGAITTAIYNQAQGHCGFSAGDLEDARKN